MTRQEATAAFTKILEKELDEKLERARLSGPVKSIFDSASNRANCRGLPKRTTHMPPLPRDEGVVHF